MYRISVRSCDGPPPVPFQGIDMNWPHSSLEMGTVVEYNCPFRKRTTTSGLSCMEFYINSFLHCMVHVRYRSVAQYVQCVWDKDTDVLSWYPSDIEECGGKYQFVERRLFRLLQTPLILFEIMDNHSNKTW